MKEDGENSGCLPFMIGVIAGAWLTGIWILVLKAALNV